MARFPQRLIVVLSLTFLAVCSPLTALPPAQAASAIVGAVYTESNSVAGNAVLALARRGDGTLTPLGTFSTGARGVGGGVDPLQSQYALVIAGAGRWLLAVNAGSNSITSFAVQRDGRLVRRAIVPSGGQRPISLAVHDDLVYVLNNGGSTDNDHGTGSIVGFWLRADGTLTPTGSARPLSGADVGSSTIAFSRSGRYLLVTERVANRVDLYRVNEDGRASAPVVTQAAGAVPFGFGFGANDVAVVSEAGPQAVSTYRVAAGTVRAVTTLPTHAAAPCWAIVTPSGRFAYVANAGGNVLMGYGVAPAGQLTDLAGPPSATGAQSTPIDVALSHDGRWLYTLNTGNGTIGSAVVHPDGQLGRLTATEEFAATSGYQGLAVW